MKEKTDSTEVVFPRGLKLLFGVLCVVGCFLVHPSPAFSEKAKEVKIGLVEPLSGPIAPIGRLDTGGVDIAVEEINSNGGIKSLGGAQLKIIKADSEGKSEVGMSATERLIQQEVSAVMGAYQSAVTFVATQVAERFKTPFVVPVAVGDDITERGFRYTFRTGQNPRQLVEGEIALIRYLNTLTTTPVKKVAIADEDSLSGQSMEKWRRKLYTEAGFDVVGSVAYPATTRDLSAEVSKIKAMKPDFLLRMGYVSDAILLTRAMYELDCNVMGMTDPSGGAEPSYITELGKLSEYSFVSSMWDTRIKIPGVKEVAAVYKKKIGQELEYKAACYYCAVYMIKDALERCGSTDREKLRDAIASTNLKSGEKGNINAYDIQFDAKGQNSKATVLSGQVLDQKLTYVFPLKYAERKPVFPVPPWKDRNLQK